MTFSSPGMQQLRPNGRVTGSSTGNGINNNESEAGKPVTTFPSRPPIQVQQKRQHRLQRQKEIDTFYQRSTSEESEQVNKAVASQKRPPRPVLQRQQRQSSEESNRSANVHFKEDPEYFEVRMSLAQSVYFCILFDTLIINFKTAHE